MHVCVCGCVRE
uniref:Uncharacterized protein n=1 Tax=Anguilla anguilla TaxID=7936 RepID=A0A0E9SJP8_ANGAN